MALALAVLLLGACPRRDVDHSTAMPLVETAVAMPPGTNPPGPELEHRDAMRASRSRSAEVDAAEAAEARRILEAAAARALAAQHQAEALMAASTPAPPAVMDAAFWRRLANCECASGHCGGHYIGWFQLSHDTAAKVGIDGSEDYETQRAAAERWLGMIGGPSHGGTRSGWPTCWWRALRG